MEWGWQSQLDGFPWFAVWLYIYVNWWIITILWWPLPYINMNQPTDIHLSPPSWTPLPRPSPPHPSRLLQSTDLGSLHHTSSSLTIFDEVVSCSVKHAWVAHTATGLKVVHVKFTVLMSLKFKVNNTAPRQQTGPESENGYATVFYWDTIFIVTHFCQRYWQWN